MWCLCMHVVPTHLIAGEIISRCRRGDLPKHNILHTFRSEVPASMGSHRLCSSSSTGKAHSVHRPSRWFHRNRRHLNSINLGLPPLFFYPLLVTWSIFQATTLAKFLSGYDETAHVPSRRDVYSKIAKPSPNFENEEKEVC